MRALRDVHTARACRDLRRALARGRRSQVAGLAAAARMLLRGRKADEPNVLELVGLVADAQRLINPHR